MSADAMKNGCVRSYYVGRPARGRAGQDKQGVVRCLYWYTIDREASPTSAYGEIFICRRLGIEIGRLNTLPQARRLCERDAKKQLLQELKENAQKAVRILDALDKLDQDGIDQFDGPYTNKVSHQLDMEMGQQWNRDQPTRP